jgi:hypothetical protein
MPGRKRDYANRVFGRWTVLAPAGVTANKASLWRCRCQCGREADVRIDHLTTGSSLSCGCLRDDRVREAMRRGRGRRRIGGAG